MVIIDITFLMDEDPKGLKRAVGGLKRFFKEMGGEMALISDSKVIATPKLVKIQLSKEASGDLTILNSDGSEILELGGVGGGD